MDKNHLTRLANIAKIFQLVTTATSAFAITGYYIGNQPLFISCAIVSAVLSLGLIVGLVVSTRHISWLACFVLILLSVLILIIGMLIDRSWMPGFLLGASILGLMILGFGKVTSYLFTSRMKMLREKYGDKMDEEDDDEMEEEDLRSYELPEGQVERVKKMEDASKQVDAMLKLLNQGIDRYTQLQYDIELLRHYMDSKQWMEDFEADEAGKLPKDMPRGVLSEDGLFNLLNRVEDVEDRFLDIVREFALEGEEE